MTQSIESNRAFLKDSLRLQIDFEQTDQNLGVAPPPIQKKVGQGKQIIKLPGREEWTSLNKVALVDAINNRESLREFSKQSLKLDELAFLLWSTQGIKQVLTPACAFRTVPSAGCRHAFETYLVVANVDTLEPAIYRYLPLDHTLVLEHKLSRLTEKITTAALQQNFVKKAAVTFIWTALPYRVEWRYGLAAHRAIALDAGHVGQNLYLACEAIGAGTCAIAAFHQDKIDALVKVDGKDEFVIYMAPVGKR